VPAPVSPVSGSFTLTVDPMLTYLEETSGIVRNALDIDADGAPIFSYDPSVGDALTISMHPGGNGVFCGTNDFLLVFNLTSNTPFSTRRWSPRRRFRAAC
jgi:hypothetical protein